MCECGCEVEFYSHIYIQPPSLYSSLLPKLRPQLSLFPVHPQRSYSWQKTHQVGRTTDNWGDDRSCSKTIDSDGDRGSGELSRLTELSRGSGSTRPECGTTRSIDTATLVAKEQNVSLFIYLLKLNYNIQLSTKLRDIFWLTKKKLQVFVFDNGSAMCAGPETTLGFINSPNPLHQPCLNWTSRESHDLNIIFPPAPIQVTSCQTSKSPRKSR